MHVLVKKLQNVVGSAAETEIEASYKNGTTATPMQIELTEMGHPQPRTPIQVDNNEAVNFANDEPKQKRTKAIEMRFYWIKDRPKQKQFMIYWSPGNRNLGDYHRKNHPPAHHRLVHPIYLNGGVSLQFFVFLFYYMHTWF